MAEETTNKPLPVNPPVDNDDVGNDSGSESTVRASSYSPICGVTLMADGKIPEMADFSRK
jgi:hypothetical protein